MLDIDRQPPKVTEATEAEQALLGAVILDPKQLDVVSDVVTGAEFYDSELGRLFGVMVDLRQAGKPIGDMMLLVRELESTEVLSRVIVDGSGGRSSLARLAGKCQYPGNAPLYANQVRDCAGLRRIAQSATSTWGAAYAPDADRLAIAERAMADLEVILAGDEDTSADLTELIESEAALVEQCCEQGKPMGITSGLTALDDIAGGFFPSEVTVLAARPSIGKSAFALDLAVRIATRGLPVLLVSLEMSGQQIAHRMLSRETGIPARRIQKAELTTRERAQLAAAREALRELSLPIKLYATGGATPARIGARARVQAAQCGVRLLIVDYLGLVQSTDRHKTLYERVSAVSREMKLLAQSLNIPILLLAQMNREGAKGLPTLEHLRDSGAIEQDADNVWFLHREDRTARECKLIVAKQRQGEVGTIELEFDGAYMSFNELVGNDWNPNRN